LNFKKFELGLTCLLSTRTDAYTAVSNDDELQHCTQRNCYITVCYADDCINILWTAT